MDAFYFDFKCIFYKMKSDILIVDEIIFWTPVVAGGSYEIGSVRPSVCLDVFLGLDY